MMGIQKDNCGRDKIRDEACKHDQIILNNIGTSVPQIIWKNSIHALGELVVIYLF